MSRQDTNHRLLFGMLVSEVEESQLHSSCVESALIMILVAAE